MTPLEQAMVVYTSEPCRRTFNEDLISHLINGFVFNTPEYFIMGRPVVSTAAYEEITDPDHAFPRELCDCWHIHLMAGDTRPAWAIMPWPLALFSFERRNDLRFYRDIWPTTLPTNWPPKAAKAKQPATATVTA